MKWRWLFPLIPLGLGFLLAGILNRSTLPNPTIQILISVSSILLLTTIAASLVLLLVIVIWELSQKQYRREIEGMQIKMAEDRRRFLRRLDHELKNPLMAMRAGLANFANAPSADARKSALATVEAQTVRLSRLTTDLRKIAELESRPLEQTTINLDQLIREVVELAKEKPEAKQKRLRLILPQAPWPLPDLLGDWDLIFLAIYNMLDNAIKFTRSGDTIEVRGREERGTVLIEVADTGPGIKNEELPFVWEELYRGEGGRTVAGSGLGLALVKAIVERHGGVVRLDSKIGQGTVVMIRLPVHSTTSQ